MIPKLLYRTGTLTSVLAASLLLYNQVVQGEGWVPRPDAIFRPAEMTASAVGSWQSAVRHSTLLPEGRGPMAWMKRILPLRSRANTRNPVVRVGLYYGRRIHDLEIRTPMQVWINGERVRGPVTISHDRHTMRAAGRDSYARIARSFEIAPADGSDPILIRTGANSRRFVQGRIHVMWRAESLQVTAATGLEEYLLGTVEPELGSLDLPAAALQAQLVASRSYLMAMSNRHRIQGFELCDGEHCQVYRGRKNYPDAFLKIAQAVRGTFLAYNGRVIPAFFHDSCGGATSAVQDVWPVAALPYLQGVADGHEHAAKCRIAPKSEWRFTAQKRSLERCFRKAGWMGSQDRLKSVAVKSTDASGRVQKVSIRTRDRARTISAGAFRRAINRYYQREVLLSAVFSMAQNGQLLRFQGRGWGHGVGLCQWGAIQLAEEGRSAPAILAHYFPRTELRTLPSADSNPDPSRATGTLLAQR